MLNRLRHPAVRDLYWAINSSSLITTADLTHWQDDTSFFIQHLSLLDKQPEPLIDWLSKGLPSHRPPRLGQYFERLWHYYFHHHPSYQLIAHNLQIKSAEKITLGELDLVVKDRQRDCVMHIELAVKFYLALNHLFRAELTPFENIDAYIGPGLKDRLIDKYLHTFRHQLPLSSSPTVKTMGIHIDEVHAIFKGRLFQPWSNINSDQPIWLFQHQLKNLPDNLLYPTLARSEWFAPKYLSNPTISPINERLPLCLERPIQIAAIDRITKREMKRLFVVPNDWEDRAIKSILPECTF
ncbi:DUF1853 family protein [Nitrincola schmidtii]|uniref:DUF1853 family protein n=1 Tax=Nitrincola schmidtii TaxID=1730894 RepID=UPI00124D5F5D|nr:DUF1853 family protein [Nitrincola schmidtii]